MNYHSCTAIHSSDSLLAWSPPLVWRWPDTRVEQRTRGPRVWSRWPGTRATRWGTVSCHYTRSGGRLLIVNSRLSEINTKLQSKKNFYLQKSSIFYQIYICRYSHVSEMSVPSLHWRKTWIKKIYIKFLASIIPNLKQMVSNKFLKSQFWKNNVLSYSCDW